MLGIDRVWDGLAHPGNGLIAIQIEQLAGKQGNKDAGAPDACVAVDGDIPAILERLDGFRDGVIPVAGFRSGKIGYRGINNPNASLAVAFEEQPSRLAHVFVFVVEDDDGIDPLLLV